MTSSVDVIIVGAGLSGLSAARTLSQKGVSVRVFEANSEVGGRTRTRLLQGSAFDLGGQWIGPTQTRMHALCKELNITTFPTFCEGRKILEIDGRMRTYRSSIPSLSPLSLLRLQWGIFRIDRLVKKAGPQIVANPQNCEQWDQWTVDQWVRKHLPGAKVRALLEAAVRVIFGADSSELSLAYFLAYLHTGGGLMNLCEIKGAAQQDRIAGGAQQLSEKLAQALGDSLMLDAPVEHIHQDTTGVTVTGTFGECRAKRVIIAMPPPMAARIDFSPALPAGHDDLMQRMVMGSTVKLLALYDEPFWRADGWSGEVVADGKPVTVVYDNTNEKGQAGLLAFIVGSAARDWSARPEAERQQRVLSQFARWFGPRAARPTLVHEQDWAEEKWTRGCPIGLLGPSSLSTLGSHLRAPCDRIHWAGTETATQWTGFMEGALQAAERVAHEVTGSLI